jgi:hypothetical protein
MPYNCETCGKDVRNPQALKNHKKSHGVFESLKPEGGPIMTDDKFCKGCLDYRLENDKLTNQINEIEKQAKTNMAKIKNDVKANQGHISAKELIQCQSHGPDAIKELNEDYVVYPKSILKDKIENHGIKLEIIKSLVPGLGDILENGIELPDELFTGKHE